RNGWHHDLVVLQLPAVRVLHVIRVFEHLGEVVGRRVDVEIESIVEAVYVRPALIEWRQVSTRADSDIDASGLREFPAHQIQVVTSRIDALDARLVVLGATRIAARTIVWEGRCVIIWTIRDLVGPCDQRELDGTTGRIEAILIHRRGGRVLVIGNNDEWRRAVVKNALAVKLSILDPKTATVGRFEVVAILPIARGVLLEAWFTGT